MKLTYPAILYPFEDNSGGYTIEFPDLPGCISEGDNLISAIEMGIDAASGWVLDEMESGYPIPKPSEHNKICLEEERGGFISMVILNMDSYAERYGNKAIRKNLTIPAWLNTFAEKNNINFSQVLQEALQAIYQSRVESL